MRLALPLIACLLPALGEAQPSSVADRIEALAVPHAERELLSGVLLVARDGDVLVERGYGFADFELRVPTVPSHRFAVGSVTKSMTEALVQMLDEAERLKLDSPVANYLPGFPTGPDGGVATVEHLLTHRAGVPHRVTDAVEETQPIHPADLVERVREAGLLFEPGSRRLYSSAGYTCLARVIEVVEGAPFERILEERVFGPAGMDRATDETGWNLMAGRARPHRLGATGGRIVVAYPPYKDLRFLTGAGSVYATARDLLRFVQAIREGVLGDELAGRVLDGDPAKWQGLYGRTNGYEASVDVLLDRGLTFVFLSNLQSASNWQLRAQIQNLLTGNETEPIPLPPPVAEPFEPPESLVGSYGRPESPAEIAVVEGKLFRGENEIYPIEGNRYYTPGSGTVMRFRRDRSGGVDALVAISGDGEASVMTRLAPP